jgi:hypothetical protein
VERGLAQETPATSGSPYQTWIEEGGMNMTDRYMEEIELTAPTDDGDTVTQTVPVFKQNWFLMRHSNRGPNTDRIADAEAHCAKRESSRGDSAVPVTLAGCIIEEPIDMDTHKGEDLAQHILDSGMQEWFDELVTYVTRMGQRERGTHIRRSIEYLLDPENVPYLTEDEKQSVSNEEYDNVHYPFEVHIYVTGLGQARLALQQLFINRSFKLDIGVCIWQWCNDTGYWPTRLEV